MACEVRHSSRQRIFNRFLKGDKMNKKECLTITTNYRSYKKTAVETTIYELLCTSESGDTRIIDTVEVEKIGKKKPTYRHQHRRMALPEGKYLNEYSWDSTQPEKFKALVDEWQALPYKEVYRASTGLTAFETRYF